MKADNKENNIIFASTLI